jgi:hypothetical protein
MWHDGRSLTGRSLRVREGCWSGLASGFGLAPFGIDGDLGSRVKGQVRPQDGLQSATRQARPMRDQQSPPNGCSSTLGPPQSSLIWPGIYYTPQSERATYPRAHIIPQQPLYSHSPLNNMDHACSPGVYLVRDDSDNIQELKCVPCPVSDALSSYLLSKARIPPYGSIKRSHEYGSCR